jgi:Domain of unknown function (DUF4185)
MFRGVTWHWETYKTAALGSDLWPVTWGDDDALYTAWGDGGGFDGSDSLGRVSLGFARIEGGPENFRGINVNGGLNAEHTATFPKKGKASGIVCVNGILYANINLQDGTWPDVHHVMAWSTNHGATWAKADWMFGKSAGQFQPGRFVNFGPDYSGVPEHLAGYVYLYGFKQPAKGDEIDRLYLARVSNSKILERASYEFFSGCDADNRPKWNSDFAAATPVLADAHGITPCSAVYDPAIRRYLAASFHAGPGQLGIFDAPEPWGPWTTVAYYEDWGRMGSDGEGLGCEFPPKWMSKDGLTLWCVFSMYGGSAKEGIKAHDRFNLVKVTLEPAR